LDLKEIRQILQMLDEEHVTDFELEADGMKLRIRKGLPIPPAPPPGETVAQPATPAAVETTAPVADETGFHIVKSPIVGTFFRSPDPNAAAFVSVGDRVKPGQVLCIIEAMKLMNEIEAEVAGEVLKIHHENGQPVQYGEPLFTLRPDL
jgi:acetyl-CoA carboxylase biotin carboxyl carrier protein